MGYLIDTCVLRELHMPRPFWRVRRAVDDLWMEDVHMSVVTFAVMQSGMMSLSQEFKQRRVRTWIRDMQRKLGKNILGVDFDTCLQWGQIMESAKRRRLKLPYPDGLIAATAKRHGLTVMTRNVGNYGPFQIEVFNPWADPKDSSYDFGEEPAEGPILPGTTSGEFLISEHENADTESLSADADMGMMDAAMMESDDDMAKAMAEAMG